ncbi:MAG: hypothetical protein ACR2N7_07860 [Acidimicrobiia bacterium]
MSDQPQIANEEEPEGSAPAILGGGDRIELVATVVLAIATILTAWSAFQAGKWGGTQAINFSEAGVARTESTRADTRAGQLIQIDAAMYLDWVSAYIEEVRAELIPADSSSYEPSAGTVSGFLYNRFRDEFRPAIDAWLATDPVNNPDAPETPFVMDEYVVAESVLALELSAEADEKGQDARDANQNGDNYVLTMVLFASVLFFAGVSAKLVAKRNRLIALGFGIFLLLAGIFILISLPILI